MQIEIFTIPLMAGEKGTEELNHFLRAHKVIDLRRELVNMDGQGSWTFCITYLPEDRLVSDTPERKGKVDYKDVLDKDSFDRFVRMRKLRKELADKEAVPAYAVFTDAELSEIAKMEEVSTTNMLKIPGIGRKKVEKYGRAFCSIDWAGQENEAAGIFDSADSQS